MLQNRIYRGEIVHKGKSYPGEHEAIIDEALWDKVQAILSENRVDRATGRAGKEPSLLMGVLFDALGGRMSPTHANKRGTRYRYYISRSLQGGSGKTEGQRIPAVALESLVVRRIRDWLSDPTAVLGAVQHVASDATEQKRLVERARDVATGQDRRPSAPSCGRASYASKSIWTALISRWIRIGSIGALTKRPQGDQAERDNPNPRPIAERQRCPSLPASSGLERRCG